MFLCFHCWPPLPLFFPSFFRGGDNRHVCFPPTQVIQRPFFLPFFLSFVFSRPDLERSVVNFWDFLFFSFLSPSFVINIRVKFHLNLFKLLIYFQLKPRFAINRWEQFLEISAEKTRARLGERIGEGIIKRGFDDKNGTCLVEGRDRLLSQGPGRSWLNLESSTLLILRWLWQTRDGDPLHLYTRRFFTTFPKFPNFAWKCMDWRNVGKSGNNSNKVSSCYANSFEFKFVYGKYSGKLHLVMSIHLNLKVCM